jgi:hypothetical protein
MKRKGFKEPRFLGGEGKDNERYWRVGVLEYWSTGNYNF